MITFKDYLRESVNSHMTHLEDLVFDLGVEGTRRAIFFLRDLRDMLTIGSATTKGNIITEKWDGSPAVFVGINPENGKFFVAKKGIFNKNPKLYYSHEEIEADTTGDLAEKLKTAYTECKKLGIKRGIFQGDVLFTRPSLQTQNIDGTNCYVFQPNTILYAVPIDSKMGEQIKQANIGIVWHTTYEGNAITNLRASFTENITSKFQPSKTSWMENAMFENVTGIAAFTPAEKEQFDSLLSEIGKKFQRMPAQTLNAIHKDRDLLMLVHIYNNSKVREGKPTVDIAAHVDGFYKFIKDRYVKELDSKKTAAARTNITARGERILSFFETHPRSEINALFELNVLLARAKMLIINKLNKITNIGTFLRTKTGLRVTNPEGFVAINTFSGAVKLVDRLEFSMANFSPEILKGWER